MVNNAIPKWRLSTIERVKKMRSDGMSNKDIAKVMKKSYNAISGLFYQIDHGLLSKPDQWGNVEIQEWEAPVPEGRNPRTHPTLPVINF